MKCIVIYFLDKKIHFLKSPRETLFMTNILLKTRPHIKGNLDLFGAEWCAKLFQGKVEIIEHLTVVLGPILNSSVVFYTITATIQRKYTKLFQTIFNSEKNILIKSNYVPTAQTKM